MALFAYLDPTGTVFALLPFQQPGIPSVDVTNANPQPGLGWTTPDGGRTWQQPAASSVLGNQAALLAKAATALSNNQTYLAIPSPTQAQAVAQVAALTRQVDALIHLAADDLEDTDGT